LVFESLIGQPHIIVTFALTANTTFAALTATMLAASPGMITT
jgi:hypothetical protein